LRPRLGKDAIIVIAKYAVIHVAIRAPARLATSGLAGLGKDAIIVITQHGIVQVALLATPAARGLAGLGKDAIIVITQHGIVQVALLATPAARGLAGLGKDAIIVIAQHGVIQVALPSAAPACVCVRLARSEPLEHSSLHDITHPLAIDALSAELAVWTGEVPGLPPDQVVDGCIAHFLARASNGLGRNDGHHHGRHRDTQEDSAEAAARGDIAIVELRLETCPVSHGDDGEGEEHAQAQVAYLRHVVISKVTVRLHRSEEERVQDAHEQRHDHLDDGARHDDEHASDKEELAHLIHKLPPPHVHAEAAIEEAEETQRAPVAELGRARWRPPMHGRVQHTRLHAGAPSGNDCFAEVIQHGPVAVLREVDGSGHEVLTVHTPRLDTGGDDVAHELLVRLPGQLGPALHTKETSQEEERHSENVNGTEYRARGHEGAVLSAAALDLHVCRKHAGEVEVLARVELHDRVGHGGHGEEGGEEARLEEGAVPRDARAAAGEGLEAPNGDGNGREAHDCLERELDVDGCVALETRDTPQTEVEEEEAQRVDELLEGRGPRCGGVGVCERA